METREQQCLAQVSKLPLWIIEYIWAHNMAHVLEDVDPSAWPEMDSQPLSLEDSGRLRVVSAKVYSIVKNRDVERFEIVLNFLEDTYRLLPRLVAPTKHMKIVFGLKTMTIMWMLKGGRGIIDTAYKINRFFPRKLPQYQSQCSHYETFLMEKNHLDFKTLVQSLIFDKGAREHYVQNQMEQHYGEHYAQKVEERLLEYLQKLETVLPGEAYIDKIVRKESPVSEEEKFLLRVVSSDPATVATALKKLLHCEVTTLDPGKELSEHQTKGPQSPLHATSSEARVGNFRIDLPFEGREEPVHPDIPTDRALLYENEEDMKIRPLPQTRDDAQIPEESCDRANEELPPRSSEVLCGTKSSPQFCSKHQRWVESILRGCSEESPDDRLCQANVAASPTLFQSSSSHASSEDLTSTQRPAPDTSYNLQIPQKPSSCRDTERPAPPPGFHPIDSVSAGGTSLSFKLHQAFPNHSAATTHNQKASVSSDRALSSARHQSSEDHALLQTTRSNPLEDIQNADMDPGNHQASTSVVKGRPSANTLLPYCPTSSDDHSVAMCLRRDASTSPFQAESVPAQITPPTKSCRQNAPVSSIQLSPRSRAPSAPRLGRSHSSRLQTPPLRLSLPSQAVLLRSKLFQPCVRLNRLSFHDCHHATDWRSSIRREEPEAPSSSGEERRMEEEENTDFSLDLSPIYTSYSSSSCSKDSEFQDPDYKPHIKKTRFLSE